MLTLQQIARAAVAQGLNEEEVTHALCERSAYAELALRDQFAKAALQGLLSNTDDADERLHRTGALAGVVAKNAYEFADAMMKARMQ